MEIKRVTEYNNPLFSQIVLNQRGAFLIDEEPYEIEIISSDSALVRGKNRENYVLCIYKSFTGLTIICKQIIVMRSLHFSNAPVEMTCWRCFSSRYYDVNYFFYATFKGVLNFFTFNV